MATYGTDTSVPGFHGNLDQLARLNVNFRTVLYTTDKTQLVLMSLGPGENIGAEIHPMNEQSFRVVDGSGYSVVNNRRVELGPGSVVVIPAGVEHDIVANNGLKLVTTYTPPNHPYDRIDRYAGESNSY